MSLFKSFALGWLLLSVHACGGQPAKRDRTPADGDAQVEQGIRFVPCGEKPCVLHKGSNDYRECLNGDSKTCFLYGKVCRPPTAKK